MNKFRKIKYRILYRVKTYNWDPDNPTFFRWLNMQDMHLARWEYAVDKNTGEHEHVLLPVTEEEAEVVLEQYEKLVEPRRALRERSGMKTGAHAKR